MAKWFILIIIVFNYSSFTRANTLVFPNIDNDVPYSKVSSLPYSEADERLKYGTDDSQYALLWRGNDTLRTSQPFVVFIHGGCWLSAYDISHSYALTSGLAQAGMDVWSIEYRRTGDTGGGWPTTFDDILLAIKRIAAYNSAEFDLSKAVLVGHSAGGHLALLAGSKLPQLQAVIGLAAITDIAAYSQGNNSCQKVTEKFMGSSLADNPALYDNANPAKQPLHPFSYLLHGNKDTIVPNSELQNTKHLKTTLPGAGHFDWLHPGSEAFTLLVKKIKSNNKS
ncbi:alpha/beta hydrolase [Colwellia sp. KU-HH00111]|uniref:alpha/beta hydrolase n=1 Tax=Colwellia sp. KU-HH00111 TaxID=3127652 RepID=UPI00310BAD30